MKKYFLFLSLIFLTACNSRNIPDYNSSNSIKQVLNEPVTQAVHVNLKSAEKIALNEINSDSAFVSKSKADNEDLSKIYEIYVVNGNEYHEFDIDSSGNILKHEVKFNNTSAQQQIQAEPNTKLNILNVSSEEAEQIALKHANVANTSFLKTEIDWENNVQVYDIEFISGNTEYSYEISATDGSILWFESEIAD